jgi:hypothetical protein
MGGGTMGTCSHLIKLVPLVNGLAEEPESKGENEEKDTVWERRGEVAVGERHVNVMPSLENVQCVHPHHFQSHTHTLWKGWRGGRLQSRQIRARTNRLRGSIEGGIPRYSRLQGGSREREERESARDGERGMIDRKTMTPSANAA